MVKNVGDVLPCMPVSLINSMAGMDKSSGWAPNAYQGTGLPHLTVNSCHWHVEKLSRTFPWSQISFATPYVTPYHFLKAGPFKQPATCVWIVLVDDGIDQSWTSRTEITILFLSSLSGACVGLVANRGVVGQSVNTPRHCIKVSSSLELSLS